MNLDNYFAKFLHKNTATHAKTAHAEELALSSRLVPVTPIQAPPVVSTGLSPKLPERQAEASSIAIREGEDRPSEDAAMSKTQQLSGRSPNAAGDANRALSPLLWGLEAKRVPSDVAREGREGTAIEPRAMKRPRELASVDTPPLQSTSGGSTPVTKRLLTRCISPSSSSSDVDDELALLLGSQNARKVREADATLEHLARAQQNPSSSPSSPSQAVEGAVAVRQQRHNTTSPDWNAVDGVDSAAACAVGSLSWQTYSSATRGTIARYFQKQFEWELRHSSTLFDAFEPFFKDRALERIAADAELRPVLLAAPTGICNETVGALPGCTLRPYQVEGVQFLLDHFHRGMSCILGDDMGLGKTAQVSAFLHLLRQLHHIEGPHLIIAPLSTLTNWTRELARWAPQLRVVKYHGERTARVAASSGRHNRHAVFVTTPALLHQDKRFFKKRTWVTVVVDEAHVLKTHDTAVTAAARKLSACYRLAVTGTPVHNNVQEVWSLMSFLYPWLMALYDSSIRDPVRQAQACAKVLQHIMLRRTKAAMELGIPPRVDEPLTALEPTYVQLQLLSLLTAHALQESSTGHQLQGHLSHQRAVCNHPMALRLLAQEGRAGGSQEPVKTRLRVAGVPCDVEHIIEPSAKMRHLDVLLPRLKAEGHRCLIFSNFTTTLDLLEAMCHLRGYSYERLDGNCNRVERELAMLRYNHPASSCFLFLVTTTAGGVGVTLTGADAVILFDAHFNPQMDRQAADRAHRIGQTRTVHVYRLCLRGTVEEHIREVATRKAFLGDFIVEGGEQRGTRGRSATQDSGGAGRITADDIREMFVQFEEKHRLSSHTSEGTPASFSSAPRAAHGSPDTDPGPHTTEDAIVEDLMQVEGKRLSGVPAVAALEKRRGGGGGTLANPPKQTHRCFCCEEIMYPMEPLLHCMVCPKAYHATCIGERPPKAGESTKRNWTCPRHQCFLCGKLQATDGAIFMCDACPRSFCFDCLDPRYLEMDAVGAHLLHIRNTYVGMEEEEVQLKRSCYYITCLRCCGVLPPSSSSPSSSDEDTDSDLDDIDLSSASGSDEVEVVEEKRPR